MKILVNNKRWRVNITCLYEKWLNKIIALDQFMKIDLY